MASPPVAHPPFYRSLYFKMLLALLIGVVENLAGGYLGSAYKTATAFVMIVALLAVRPQGLFGIQKRREI